MAGLPWKKRHAAVFVLFLVWIVSYMDRMVMATAVPYIARDFGMSAAVIGGVLSAFFVGYAAFQIPGGIMADRFGARRVLSAAMLWWSGFTGLTGLAASLPILLWTRVLFGIGEGIAPASTWKACAVWSPLRSRGMANALMLCSNPLGTAIAPIFVATLMAHWSWRVVFAILTIPGALLALYIWYRLPDNPADAKNITVEEVRELQENDPAGHAGAPTVGFWQVLKLRPVWHSCLIFLFYNMTQWGFGLWLPSYLVQARGLSLAKMGIAASLPFFAGTISLPLGGWLADRLRKHDPRILLVSAFWITAALFYRTYKAESVDALMVWQTIAGFSMCLSAGLLYSLPMSSVPRELTGRAMGIFNTGGQVGGFVSPLVIGFLVEAAGGGARSYDHAFMFLIAATLAASIVTLFFPGSRPSGINEAATITGPAGTIP